MRKKLSIRLIYEVGVVFLLIIATIEGRGGGGGRGGGSSGGGRSRGGGWGGGGGSSIWRSTGGYSRTGGYHGDSLFDAFINLFKESEETPQPEAPASAPSLALTEEQKKQRRDNDEWFGYLKDGSLSRLFKADMDNMIRYSNDTSKMFGYLSGISFFENNSENQFQHQLKRLRNLSESTTKADISESPKQLSTTISAEDEEEVKRISSDNRSVKEFSSSADGDDNDQDKDEDKNKDKDFRSEFKKHIMNNRDILESQKMLEQMFKNSKNW